MIAQPPLLNIVRVSKLTTVYLSHSPREKERGLKVQKALEELGVTVLNPFALQLGIEEFKWEELDKIRYRDSIRLCKAELEMLNNADIIVALYPKDMATVGITSEIIIGRLKEKKIVTVVDRKYIGHPWLVFMSDFILENDEKICIIIKTLLAMELREKRKND